MTLIELIKEKEDYYNNLAIDVTLKDFMNEYSLEISKFKDYPFGKRVLVLYLGVFDLTVKEAIDDINYLEPLLEFLNGMDIDTIFKMMSQYLYVRDILVENYQISDFTEEIFEKYYKIYKKDKSFKRVKESIQLLKQRVELNIDDILLWLSDIRYAEILACNLHINEITRIEKNYKKQISEIENKNIRSFVEKENKKEIEKAYNAFTKRFTDLFNDVNHTKNQANTEVSKKEKNRNKKLQALNFLEKDISNNNLKLENLLKYDLDEEVLNLALLELLKNKNEGYIQHYQEYLNLKNNSIGKLEEIFHAFNYNFNLLTEEEQNELSNFKVETLRENLNFIRTSSLSFIEEIDAGFIILITLDSKVLMQLDSLLKRNKISKEFILKNYKLIKDYSYELINNINKLDYKKINLLKLIQYSDEILFNLNAELFDTICTYNIDMTSENAKYFEYLENPKLLDLIDKYIEANLYKTIKTSPNLINSAQDSVFKRVIVMQLLNNEVLNEHNTFNQTVRTGTNFYISDNELDNYVHPNYSLFMDTTILDILNANENIEILKEIPEEILFVENYKKSEQIYMIGDKIFSRLKVLRCLNTLIKLGLTNYKELLFQCLIYNYPYDLSYDEVLELQNIDKGIMRKKI